MSAQPFETYRPSAARGRILPVPVTEPAPVPVASLRAVPQSPSPGQDTLAFDPGAVDPANARWRPGFARTGPERQNTLASTGIDTPEAGTSEPHIPGTSPSGLPDPRRTIATLAPAVVEVLAGVRPASQLVRWTSQDVHAALARRAAVAARVGRPSVPGRPPVVRAVRVCRPNDRVAEASAVVVDSERIRAVAVRLEALDGRWRATALEIG